MTVKVKQDLVSLPTLSFAMAQAVKFPSSVGPGFRQILLSELRPQLTKGGFSCAQVIVTASPSGSLTRRSTQSCWPPRTVCDETSSITGARFGGGVVDTTNASWKFVREKPWIGPPAGM